MAFKIGKYYMVIFDDHVKGMSRQLECKVFGKIIEESEKVIVINWWNIIDDDEDVKKDNTELLSILKSTITKKRMLPSWCQDE